VLFETADGIVPLEQLSDGYQNMAAWIGDLLYRVNQTFRDYKKPLEARGLLLIDEIDLHLHPKWQRKLLEFISNKLPNFQVIAATHSPLTAQQADEGELYALKRDTKTCKISIIPFIGLPKALLVNQLLMTPIFGLETDESLEVEKTKKAYDEFKSQEDNLTENQQEEFKVVKKDLNKLYHSEISRFLPTKKLICCNESKSSSIFVNPMIPLSRIRTAKAVKAAFRGAGKKLKDKELMVAERLFLNDATKPVTFKSTFWKSSKDQLKIESSGKCAYCEADTDVVAQGDVEHYRPKSIYWWLAYTYDNYLFACQICNQIYKSDTFPISGIV